MKTLELFRSSTPIGITSNVGVYVDIALMDHLSH